MDSTLDGLFSTIGTVAGGAAGSFLGPGIGTAVGGMVGGAAGGMLDKQLAKGKGGKGKKKPRKRKVAAAVEQKVAVAKAARVAGSQRVAAVATQSGVSFDKLAKAAGVDPRKAKAAGVTSAALVRRLGVAKVAKLAGGRASQLFKAAGISAALARATGLNGSRAGRAVRRKARPISREVRIVIQQCAADCGPRVINARLSGLDDDDDFGAVDSTTTAGPSGGAYAGPNAGKTPGSVPVRAANWDLGASRYRLASGDTLYGLAITYLGNGNDWKLIWAAQPDSFRWNNKPDKLAAGTWLQMPPAAVTNARKLIGAGPGAVVAPNGTVTGGSAIGGATATVAGLASNKNVQIAAGVAGVGALAYFLTRR